MKSLLEQICDLDDDLLEKRQRFDELDDMEEDDSDFDEDEYNKLEKEIDEKGEMLINFRSKMQCLDVIQQIDEK